MRIKVLHGGKSHRIKGDTLEEMCEDMKKEKILPDGTDASHLEFVENDATETVIRFDKLERDEIVRFRVQSLSTPTIVASALALQHDEHSPHRCGIDGSRRPQSCMHILQCSGLSELDRLRDASPDTAQFVRKYRDIVDIAFRTYLGHDNFAKKGKKTKSLIDTLRSHPDELYDAFRNAAEGLGLEGVLFTVKDQSNSPDPVQSAPLRASR